MWLKIYECTVSVSTEQIIIDSYPVRYIYKSVAEILHCERIIVIHCFHELIFFKFRWIIQI